MKLKMSTLLMALTMMMLGTSWVTARDTSSSGKSKSDTRTVTGCLSQGDNAKEFLLAGDDGSTWEVRSSTLKLSDHVGHTVSATGVVKNVTAHNMKEDTKDMAADAHMTKSNDEHGHLTVTDLKMVSESCQKQ
jgi:hypothetical protein